MEQSAKIELLRLKSKGTVDVKIRFVIIPHTNNFDDSRRCKAVNRGYKKANDMQGLYLYRNSRLIQYGGWHNMYGDTTEEHNKLGKILIDFRIFQTIRIKSNKV